MFYTTFHIMVYSI